jgi:hypothetical protein
MSYISQDEPGYAAATSNPRIPRILWEINQGLFLIRVTCVLQIGQGSALFCYPETQAKRHSILTCASTVRHQEGEAMSNHALFPNASMQR